MHAKMPVLTVNMIFKFAPLVLKCIGANRNRAWIIHENEKYSLNIDPRCEIYNGYPKVNRIFI